MSHLNLFKGVTHHTLNFFEYATDLTVEHVYQSHLNLIKNVAHHTLNLKHTSDHIVEHVYQSHLNLFKGVVHHIQNSSIVLLIIPFSMFISLT